MYIFSVAAATASKCNSENQTGSRRAQRRSASPRAHARTTWRGRTDGPAAAHGAIVKRGEESARQKKSGASPSVATYVGDRPNEPPAVRAAEPCCISEPSCRENRVAIFLARGIRICTPANENSTQTSMSLPSHTCLSSLDKNLRVHFEEEKALI